MNVDETLTESPAPKRPLWRLIKRFIVLIALVTCCPWTYMIYHAWEFAPSRIVGLPPQQVIDKVGKPLYAGLKTDHIGSGGQILHMNDQQAAQCMLAGEDGTFVYQGWYWQRYVIQFQSGIAVKSYDSGK